MNRELVSGLFWGWLVGCAFAAGSQGIPVYREYSQPIAIYDESGHLASGGEVAVDVRARKMMRDAKAQEALLGQETLWDMTFSSSESVFGKASPPPMAAAAPAAGGGEGRRRKGGADDNWLAKSLSLPALGQTHSNAAMSVIGGNKESAWGWLADEVSWREESDMTREEMMRAEAEVLNVGGAQNVALENMPNPFAGLGSDGAAKGAEEGTTVQRVTAAARPAEGDAAKVSVPPAGVGGAPGPAAPILRPEATARPELSQTRKAIAEMTGGMKTDFAALRESLVAGKSAPEGGAGARPDFSAVGGRELGARSVLSVEPLAGAGGTGLGAIRGPTSVPDWGGRSVVGGASTGWKADWSQPGMSVDSGVSRGGWGGAPAAAPNPPGRPTPSAITPSRTIGSGGGYKPVWH
ncbi:MAG: hypothetical protein ACOX3F_01980 [Kiritimatiellia bacterium]|jgi:hypothetical protein